MTHAIEQGSRTPGSLTLDTAAQSLTVLAGYLEGFLEAWDRDGEPPSIAAALPDAGELRRVALVELIKIDLEYRWGECNLPKGIDEYIEEFPELAEGGVPADLIYEEFHLRRQSGLNVDPQEYLDKFPAQARELECLLGLDEPYQSTALLNESRKRLLDGIQVGQKLDDFQLLAHLGQGAFASVYLARQESMQRLVALKVSASYGTEPQTLAQLDHDHIVRVYDLRTLTEGDLRLLYMQYIAGGTLQSVIKRLKETPAAERDGRVLLHAVDRALEDRGESRPAESALRERIAAMTWPQAVCWIGARLAEALDYAHQRGVLHRDVKPANVLLTADGVPKLADFNISFSSKLAGATPAAYFGGSLAYMSPEQLEASNPAHDRRPESLDGRSDIYSLGVLLWELLTGERPFADEVEGGWVRILERMTERRRQGVDEATWNAAPTGCPAGLIEVLRKCLAPEPADRFQTGEALARQLELCRKPHAQRLLYPPPQSWRRRLLPFVVLLVVLAAAVPNILAGAFNYLYNDHRMRDTLQENYPAFQRTQVVINSIAYPVGLGLGALLVLSVSSAVKELQTGKDIAPQRLRELRGRCLRLGHYLALIGVVEWAIAGIAYPVSIHVQTGHMLFGDYTHFFGSLIVCGLIAAAYPFFGVTFLCVRTVYPRLLRADLADDSDLPTLERLSRAAWFYLILAAAVPLLGVTAFSFIESDSDMSRWALRVLGAIGFLGLVSLLPVFRALQSDLAALTDALSTRRR